MSELTGPQIKALLEQAVSGEPNFNARAAVEKMLNPETPLTPLGQIEIKTHDIKDGKGYSFGDNWFSKAKLKELIGDTEYSLADPIFSHEFKSHNLDSIDECIIEGEWVIAGDLFYQVQAGTESRSWKLAREYIRPQLWLAHGNEDFEVKIENGKLKDQWIYDASNDEKIIKRAKGKVTVDGKEISGDYAINLGFGAKSDNLNLIFREDGSCELINQAVYEAREAAAAEALPAPETAEKTNWNEIPSAFIKAVGKEAGVFFNVFKPRDWRDLFALTVRGLSEIGGPVGATARAVLLLSNFASIGLKEHLTIKQIRARIETDIKNIDLSKKDKKTLARKAYWQQTILGKLLSENDQSNLYKVEELMAISIGVIAALGGMSTGKLAASMLPGSSVQEILLNRGLFSYIMPRLISYVGRKSYELIWPLGGFEQKTSKEAAAKEFVEMSLGAMSATVTTLVTAGFILDVGGELLSKLPQFAATAQARATQTTSPTEAVATATVMATATLTHQPPTETQPATETPTNIPPTETATLPPTLEDLWQPGEPVERNLLVLAAEKNYGWGVDLDHDGDTDFQVFWLDQNQGPDVVRDIINNEQYIRGEDNLFHQDFNHNGQIDGNEPFAATTLSLIDPSLEQFKDVPQAEVPSLSNQDVDVIDINAGDVAKAGKAGLAAPVAVGAEFGEAQQILDINKDGRMDIMVDDEGQFADNNYDGIFTEKVDTRISEPIDFDVDRWQLNKVVYEDGSMWVRNDEGNLVGVLPDGRNIRLDDSSGTSRLQVQMQAANPGWSPWFLGRQAVINPENLPIPAVPVTPEPEPILVPETDTSEEHGQPEDGFLVQSDGHRLILGPDGGEQGMLQQEIHENNPDLDPDALGVVAHRVALTNDPSVSMINQQTAIVSVERWLESNQGWLANNGHPWETLSQGERYEIAKIFVNTYHPVTEPTTFVTGKAGIDFLIHYLGGTFDDDDDMKASILSIIEQVEDDPDRHD